VLEHLQPEADLELGLACFHCDRPGTAHALLTVSEHGSRALCSDHLDRVLLGKKPVDPASSVEQTWPYRSDGEEYAEGEDDDDDEDEDAEEAALARSEEEDRPVVHRLLPRHMEPQLAVGRVYLASKTPYDWDVPLLMVGRDRAQELLPGFENGAQTMDYIWELRVVHTDMLVDPFTTYDLFYEPAKQRQAVRLDKGRGVYYIDHRTAFEDGDTFEQRLLLPDPDQ
jgi:hypothetical protein